jgi:lincosamide nucleotidyltransferase A/C/D/E
MTSRPEQLSVIHAVVRSLDAARIGAWLFGGWGLDARLGRTTREHGDIEFWVERCEANQSKQVLVQAGAIPLPIQCEEESCEFLWAGVPFSTAYFDHRPDGTFGTQGRWSDWVFPVGSFDDLPGILDGMPVPVMSVVGMVAMKEQYPRLRNGRPWRTKDIKDLAALRQLLTGAEQVDRDIDTS